MADAAAGGETAPRFLIKGQYVKDISFENPHAPHSLTALEEKPRIEVSVNLKAQRFNEQHFELVLHLSARATGKDTTLLLLELDYGAIVQFIGIDEAQIERILLIDCAFVLFPFARRVVSDVTRDGGFPPLMLEPIDFHGLYLSREKESS